MSEDDVQALLQAHWSASDANDFAAKHAIYHHGAMLEYPQSSERIRGRDRIHESHAVQPDEKRFTVRRGNGLWIGKLVLTSGDRHLFRGVRVAAVCPA